MSLDTLHWDLQLLSLVLALGMSMGCRTAFEKEV